MNSMSLTRHRRPAAWTLAASVLAASLLGVTGGAGTAYATPDAGGFNLGVQVNVDNAHLFPVDRVWEVSYKCGTEEAQTVLLEDGATHAVTGIPVGTTCTIDPLGDKAAIQGYSLGQEVTVDGALSREVAILAGATPSVDVANTYTYQPGVFRVMTATKGSGMGKATGPFTYNWSCTLGGNNVGGGTFSIDEGVAENIYGLPAGAECTVTQVDPEAPGTTLDASWTVDNGAPRPGNAMTFVVNDWTAVNLMVTNTYTLTDPVPVETGTFEVAARVATADGSPAPSGTYDLSVGCWHNGENVSIEVTGVSSDGTPIASPAAPLPVGSSCALSAKSESAQRAGYTLVDPMPVPVVFTIDSADTPTRVTMQYTYAQAVGALELVVKTEGHPTAGNDTFPTTYNCGVEDITAEMKGDGTVGRHDALTAGASCTVTPNAAAAERDGYTVATTLEGSPAVIPGNGVARVTVTHVYTPKPVDQPADPAQSAKPADPAQSAGGGAQSGGAGQSGDAAQSTEPADPAQSAGDSGQSADTAQSTGDTAQSTDAAQSAGEAAQSGDASQSAGDTAQSVKPADPAQSANNDQSAQGQDGEKDSDKEKTDGQNNPNTSNAGSTSQTANQGTQNPDSPGNQGNAGTGNSVSTNNSASSNNAGPSTALKPLTAKPQGTGTSAVPGGQQGSSSSSTEGPSAAPGTATPSNAVPMTELAKEQPNGTGRLAITGTNAQLLLMTSLLTLLIGAGVITAIRRTSSCD